jgi:chromosome segregation ATPase
MTDNELFAIVTATETNNQTVQTLLEAAQKQSESLTTTMSTLAQATARANQAVDRISTTVNRLPHDVEQIAEKTLRETMSEATKYAYQNIVWLPLLIAVAVLVLSSFLFFTYEKKVINDLAKINQEIEARTAVLNATPLVKISTDERGVKTALVAVNPYATVITPSSNDKYFGGHSWIELEQKQ